MKSVYVLFLLIMSLAATVNACAAGSVLSVNCQGEDVGAEVFVNGKFKGECPLDIKVPVGKLKLKVQKKVDAFSDRIFEQEIRMGDDVVKKIDVILGAAQLNAKGKRQKPKMSALEGKAKTLRKTRRNVSNVPRWYRFQVQISPWQNTLSRSKTGMPAW